MAIRQPLSTGTSESCIIFYNGGHNHDGISSALISTAKYSIYDFTTDFIGTDLRQSVQSENFRKFKNVIADIVKTDVLTTAGITLTPNQVRAENISAGAVTATSLAANIVLVNNVIKSNNFDGTILANGAITGSGTLGWAITGAGNAVFSNTSIRGAVEANSVSTPGVDIFANGTLAANSFTLYGNGAIVTSSGKFSVDADGNLFSNSATITGTVTATSVSTPGIDILSDGSISSTNFNVTAGGNITATNVNLTGAINATSGSIDGDLISGGTISGVELDIGANFYVDASGNLTATNVNLTGSITATSGSFSGNLLSGGTISSTNISGVSISGVNIDGSTITVGSRIALPSDGTQILLGTASGGSATQVTIYDAGLQGMKIDTSSNGSTTIAGDQWNINNIEFVSQRYITGLSSFLGTGTDLVVSAGEVFRKSSKRELKDNIQDFSDVSLIDNLRPVTFIWKKNPYTKKTETEEERLRRESSVNIGFIAEEVEDASDGLLSVYNYEEGGDGEVEMYKYLDIIALSVANIQDLRIRVVELESRLAEIEG
jgi:hypothetical protein